MTISERTLREWRKEALLGTLPVFSATSTKTAEESYISIIQKLYQEVIKMTQELLDQHLLRK